MSADFHGFLKGFSVRSREIPAENKGDDLPIR
jgi:hypothetical protein